MSTLQGLMLRQHQNQNPVKEGYQHCEDHSGSYVWPNQQERLKNLSRINAASSSEEEELQRRTACELHIGSRHQKQ